MRVTPDFGNFGNFFHHPITQGRRFLNLAILRKCHDVGRGGDPVSPTFFLTGNLNPNENIESFLKFAMKVKTFSYKFLTIIISLQLIN